MIVFPAVIGSVTPFTCRLVVMYYTPGHLGPGCVVHHYSQFYGKIFWNKAIAQTNLKSDSTSDRTSEFKK